MINEKLAIKYCKNDISQIENYDKAIADKTQVWHCHHRRETIYSRSGLIEIGEYYNRPAEELIFLTPNEHHRLHNLGKPSGMNGKHHSAETRKKMSESRKGDKNPNFGKPMPDERKAKLSKNNGSHRQEVRDKISKTRIERRCGIGNKNAVGHKGHTGLRWITDGINERAIPIGDSPQFGWYFGRRKRKA